MSELTVRIEDYINEETMAKIVEDEARWSIRNYFGNDVERKLSNLMHNCLFNIVDEIFKDNERDFRAEINEQIEKCIAEMPWYNVFREKDDFIHKKNSPAFDILQEEELNARPLIKARVEKVLDETYIIERLTEDNLIDVIYDVIKDRVFGKKEQ